MNMESPMMLFYATSGWLPSAANKLAKQVLPKAQDDPETGTPCRCGTPVGGGPETGPSLLLRGPKLGPYKGAQSKAGTSTQVCEAAAQVRSGAAHAWRRTAQPQLWAAYSRLRLKQPVLRSEDRSAIW
jgi:hypothetical protein